MGLRYLIVHVEMGYQSVMTIDDVRDEPAAYRLALQHALMAIEVLQATRQASEQELNQYNQAGLPVLRLALEPDQLCRKVLSDLNQTFRLFSRPLILVVSISV